MRDFRVHFPDGDQHGQVDILKIAVDFIIGQVSIPEKIHGLLVIHGILQDLCIPADLVIGCDLQLAQAVGNPFLSLAEKGAAHIQVGIGVEEQYRDQGCEYEHGTELPVQLHTAKKPEQGTRICLHGISTSRCSGMVRYCCGVQP